MIRPSPLLFFALVISGCTEDPPALGETGETNVLLIILDDVGSVSFGPYADYWAKKTWQGKTYKPARTAPTPAMDSICKKGVRFLDAWSYPTCSPTRASIFTGRHGFRTGVGEPCTVGTNVIGADEPSLPSIIKKALPAHGLGSVGKWHLGTPSSLGGHAAPNTMGWPHYAGVLHGAADYFSWQRTVNGVTRTSSTYATTQLTDDAISFYRSLSADQPSLLWLAYTAPHTPLHLPTAGLHSYTSLSATYDASKALDYYEAMLEAADTEIARLLRTLPDEDGDGLPDNTLVILLGDNGTLNGDQIRLLPAPFDGAKGKGSVFEHGVRVPLCIAGTGVATGGRDEDALVHVVDLYSTMLEAAGVDLATLPTGQFTFDSVSLTPYLRGEAHKSERTWVLTEQFASATSPNTFAPGIAIKSADYKYVRIVASGDSLSKYKERCLSTDNLVDDMAHDLYGGTDARATAACDALRDTALGVICKESGNPWATWCP